MPNVCSPIICGMTSFCSGISIALIILLKKPGKITTPDLKIWNLLMLVILGGIIWNFHYSFGKLLSLYPLDYRNADMLPILKIMAHRWLHGQAVYEIIPEIWGGMKPIYLPGLWLPFTVPVLLNIDVRWITLFLLNGSLSLLILLGYKKTTFLNMLFLGCGLWLLTNFFLIKESNIFLLTEEGIIYGYYVLLAIALFHKNYYFIGISLALCLMSRYLILGFAVSFLLYALFHFKNHEYRVLLVSFLVTILTVILCSNSFTELVNFIKLPGLYLKSCLVDIKRYEENIMAIRHSFAYLFYPAKIKLFYHLAIFLAFAVPFGLFIFNRIKPFKNQTYFLFATIKISMVLFFAFLIIPFGYLTFTSGFFSLSICYLASLNRVQPLDKAQITNESLLITNHH